MPDIKITDLPLGTEILDQDELLYIDSSDKTAGPNGTDKRIKIGKLRNIATREITTDFMINNTITAAPGDVVTTQGFTTKGDGGGADWIKTSETGTPSQTPSDLGDIKLTDSGGNVWEYVVKGKVIKPLGLGAGFGNDDGAVLNACFQWLRENVSQSDESVGMDGELASYNTTISLNATKIVGWNWFINNLNITGTNTGSITLNCIGSRGGSMSNVSTYGDLVAMPTAGIVFARSSEVGFGFASHWNIVNVSTIGYYSIIGFFAHGQETTHYDTCRFWNYNPNGRAAAFTGTDADIALASEYAQPITGGTSFINNTYSNIDARYLPLNNTAVITNISKSNPCVVTVNTTREWENGDEICLGQIVGMTELNNIKATIGNVTPTSFELVGIDSTSFSTYVSGGTVFLANTVPPVYFSRAKGHEFTNLYIVSYGQPHLEISNSGGTSVAQVSLDCLFEGFGSESHVIFSNLNTDLDLIDFNLRCYNTHANKQLITQQGLSDINISGGSISVTNFAYESLNLFNDPSKYNLYGVDLTYPDYSLLQIELMGNYSGNISVVAGNFKTVRENPTLDFVPTVTAQNGTLGSYTVDYYRYKTTDDIVKVSASVTITDIGTATGNIYVTNPITPTSVFISTGRENVVTGDSLQVITNAVRTTVNRGVSGNFQTGAVLLFSPEYY